MKTLEQILQVEKQRRCEEGAFGIKECKKSIEFSVRYYKDNLYQLLEEYVNRANNDAFFNKAMVLAVWELINNK